MACRSPASSPRRRAACCGAALSAAKPSDCIAARRRIRRRSLWPHSHPHAAGAGTPDGRRPRAAISTKRPRIFCRGCRWPSAICCGSSVKFCYLAQGEADVYPRLSPTREWDMAAGCAILAAAGGTVINAAGRGRCRSAAWRKSFWCRASSPGAIRPRPRSALDARTSAPDGARNLGPFALGGLDNAARIGDEGRARLRRYRRDKAARRSPPRTADDPAPRRRARSRPDRSRQSAAYRLPGARQRPRGCPRC